MMVRGLIICISKQKSCTTKAKQIASVPMFRIEEKKQQQINRIGSLLKKTQQTNRIGNLLNI